MKKLLSFVLFIIFLLVCSCESSVTGHTDLNDNIQTQVSKENNIIEKDVGIPTESTNNVYEGLEPLQLAQQQPATPEAGTYDYLNLTVSGANHPYLKFEWPNGRVGPGCVVEIWRGKGVTSSGHGYGGVRIGEWVKVADVNYAVWGFQAGYGYYHDYSITEKAYTDGEWYYPYTIFTAYQVRARFQSGEISNFSNIAGW